MSPGGPCSRPSWSCSEPMPISSPLRADQRSAAPVGMRRRGEDRLIDHIFPVAGELLLGDDASGDRTRTSAGAADHDALADRDRAGIADRQRRQVETGQRLDQPETCRLVIGQHGAGHVAAVDQREPDRLRLGDEIADGQNQPVGTDQHAIAGALGAQRVGGEGIRRDDGAHAHHGGQRGFKIVGIVRGLGLRSRRYLPIAHRGHAKNSCCDRYCSMPNDFRLANFINIQGPQAG